MRMVSQASTAKPPDFSASRRQKVRSSFLRAVRKRSRFSEKGETLGDSMRVRSSRKCTTRRDAVASTSRGGADGRRGRGTIVRAHFRLSSLRHSNVSCRNPYPRRSTAGRTRLARAGPRGASTRADGRQYDHELTCPSPRSCTPVPCCAELPREVRQSARGNPWTRRLAQASEARFQL